MNIFDKWFAEKKWTPFKYQKETWNAYSDGYSGIVHASTGMGKTYAIWLAFLREFFNEDPRNSSKDTSLKVLWITPLRALANDLLEALKKPVEELELPISLGIRTGDVSAATRKKQRETLPTALIITPESLSLFLSYEDMKEKLSTLDCVVVDEWHELLGTKRGVQTELAIARLKRWNKNLKVWGLSATIGNLGEALDVLVGSNIKKKKIINGPEKKKVEIKILTPPKIEKFPWGGHLGIKMLPKVIKAIENANSSLVFTNVRSATEIWFNNILESRPDWAGEIALHHGSIDKKERLWVENELRDGNLKCVVCTSSLDLGVDFSPVDQVIQIGSPKGVARTLQRAGRSGHNPKGISKILCVPTHAFEIFEFVAVRNSLKKGVLETKKPLTKSLDVLCQHLVTVALGGGFKKDDLLKEVKTTFCFSEISNQEWQWALNFLDGKGTILKNYPQYSRIEEENGVYKVTGLLTKRFHRLSIGTITSDASIDVRYLNSKRVGTVEELFIAKMKKGDRFMFGGKTLELVILRDMAAYVKVSKKSGTVPRWGGGRLPISSLLGEELRNELEIANSGKFPDKDLKILAPLIETQKKLSKLPEKNELLIEQIKTRQGYHTFIFPFEGVLTNEGIAALLAYRLTQIIDTSLTITASEYGFDLLSTKPVEFTKSGWKNIFDNRNLVEDLLESVNVTELARRQFRDIARVSCLTYSGYPGAKKKNRRFQVSSSVLYDVLSENDENNLLVAQAKREVLEAQMEVKRLEDALKRIKKQKILIEQITQFTPLSFPLYAQEIQKTQVSSESWSERIERMSLELEKNTGTKN